VTSNSFVWAKPYDASKPKPAFDVRRDREEVAHFAGLDLGQSNHYSALAVLRRVRTLVKYDVGPWEEAIPTIYQVGFCERWPLGTSYTKVATDVSEVLKHPRWEGNINLALDLGSVGRAVADILKTYGVPYMGITSTSGNGTNVEQNEARVPRNTLVSLLQSKLDQRLLFFHADLPMADTLRAELESIQTKFSDSGRLTFTTTTTDGHADMASAIMCALWRACYTAARPAYYTYSFHMSK
jgi:hypothetical protein